MSIGSFVRAAPLLTALTLATPVFATSVTTDQSDLWWAKPAGSESGWGIQLVQRGSTIFGTMFVYDANNNPIWYVATMAQQVQPFHWSGTLYQTTGPWWGAVPFNPLAVTATAVGTMNWFGQYVNEGFLTYTINGTTVTKDVVRETLVAENWNGTYIGASRWVQSQCASAANDTTNDRFDSFTVTQDSNNNMTIATVDGDAKSCTYTGTYTQYGQMGKLDGTYTCNDGSTGNITFTEMQINISAISASFTATNAPLGCQVSGWFGAMSQLNRF